MSNDRPEGKWDPGQYLRYGGHRLRPAIELFQRIDLDEPSICYDIGCGAGEIAIAMTQRWPSAKVIGLDASAEMLAKSRSAPGGNDVEWVEADIVGWAPEKPADVIYSNAALHWVDGHDTLFPHLMQQLAPGGVLAVQMPLSWGQASHRLLREVLANGNNGEGYGSDELRQGVGRKWVDDGDVYFDRLRPYANHIDIWECHYLQELSGDDPVLEWVKGSALRPVLTALGETAASAFLAEYGSVLRDAYPKRSDGATLFPFGRLFMIAQRS
jgi:trans-aconitate 2-methyltransferase